MGLTYHVKRFRWFAAVAGLGLWAVPASAPAATTYTYQYQVTFADTSALATDAADGSYALYFALASGGAPGVTNTVTVSGFNLGAGGGVGSAASVESGGDVSANPSLSNPNGVTLVSDANPSSFFAQDFTPGGSLSFRLTTTADLIDNTGNQSPDGLSIQILDDASPTDSFAGTGANPSSGNVTTTDPDGSESFATLTYAYDPSVQPTGTVPEIATYASVAPAGVPAPTVTLVPEPVSAAALSFAAIALVRRTRRAGR